MGDPNSFKPGSVSFPVDFLDVGLLKARTFKPMGLLVLDSKADLTYKDLLEEVKIVALRQLNEVKKVEDIRVFVRHVMLEPGNKNLNFAGYIGRFKTPTAKDVEQFLNNTLASNLPLQIEVWKKSDVASPAGFYTRFAHYPSLSSADQTAASTVLKVEAIQLEDERSGFEVNSLMDGKDRVRHFTARFLTNYCIRAFRKDLDRRILLAIGITLPSQQSVEIYFRRKPDPGQTVVGKSKDSFEDCVFNCLMKGTPLRVQYKLRDSSSLQTKPVPAIPVKEKQSSDLSFGAKTSFGHQPASTAPASVTIPKSGSPFDQFVRSGPLRMSDTGSATSFKTLHDGFYEAVKQASQSRKLPIPAWVQPEAAAAAPLPTTTIPVHFIPRKVEESASEKEFKEDMQKSEKTIGKEAGSSRVGRNSLALSQVESMLTKFMINLNQILLDNFGDDASTLSILHDPIDQSSASEERSQRENIGNAKAQNIPHFEKKESEQRTSHHGTKCQQRSTRVKAVRHNAYCDLCNQIIVGKRHKCVNCPDWDCCDKCRVTAEEAHPGHCLMVIESLHALRSPIKPTDWVEHPHVLCDGCDGKIIGPRYKCIGCDDFDWCASCEANPSMKHELGDHHIFLKINKPIGESVRLSHFVWQGREIVGEIQGSLIRGADVQQQHQMQRQSQERKVQEMQEQGQRLAQEMQMKQRKEQQDEMQENWNRLVKNDFKIYDEQVKTPTEKYVDEAASLDILADSGSNDKVANMPILVPDSLHSMEAKKRSERSEDDSKEGNESKKAAKESNVFDTNLDAVQQRLANLCYNAQKLPGAQSVAGESPIKAVKKLEMEATEGDKEDYDMVLVGDVNMPDGTRVVAGSQFEKVWSVKNTGRKAWPASTILRLTLSSNGANSDRIAAPLNSSVHPQETVNVGITDLMAGEQLGHQHLYFRLELPKMGSSIQGKRFGQQLWCQVQVVDGSLSNSASSFVSAPSDKVDQWDNQVISSLGSSLFQLPRAPGSVAATSEADTNVVSATDPLTETEDVDSVSLASSDGDDEDFEIIEPSSDGEDDDESYL